MRRSYWVGCSLVAIFTCACSGGAQDAESIGSFAESVTAVPQIAVTPTRSTATMGTTTCWHDWFVETASGVCPSTFPTLWFYDSVYVPNTQGKRYCAYVSRTPAGNHNGPLPNSIQAPMRSGCAYAPLAPVPSATPLSASDCRAADTCELPIDHGSGDGTVMVPTESGGRPVYFNWLGRTISVKGSVTRVRLVASVLPTIAADPAPSGNFIEYPIPVPGFYQLTGGPEEIAGVYYLDPDDPCPDHPEELCWHELEEQ